MFRQSVYLMSAEANEAVLFDREGRFSAKKGWERVLAELFPQLCQACDEHGQQYSDEEIVDHLIFLMMAAHDTTTSAIIDLQALAPVMPDVLELTRFFADPQLRRRIVLSRHDSGPVWDSQRDWMRALGFCDLVGLSAESLCCDLAASAIVQDRRHKLSAYPACLVGSEAVTWMAGQFAISRDQ